MNSLRLRIFFLMFATGLVPLTILAFGLRFLPGGALPWVLYGGLSLAVFVGSVALSGFISRPLKGALQAMSQVMRSAGGLAPRVWVPKEYRALQNSLANLLREERDQRVAVEKQVIAQGAALAEAENAAMRSIRVLGAVVDACDEAIVFMHADGHVILCNQRAVELLSISKENQQHGMEAEKWLTSVASVFNDSSTVASTWTTWQSSSGIREADWQTKDGRDINVHTIDVRKDEGQLLGRLWIFRDVTERRMMQLRLQESQKMEAIGQLAGGIAHDFNNLLTAIRGNLVLAELAENDRDAYRSKIDDASRAAGRAAELVNQILGYSRKGRSVSNIADVSQVVSEVRNILRASLDPKVALRVTTPKELWRATADPVQVEQVLLNLCLNARDALPETGGNIDISAVNLTGIASRDPDDVDHAKGDYVVIKVRDNGAGIPLESRERIFEPFYTTKEKGKGTGLGLATVKRIVEEVGGWLEFDSDVGKGTEFRVFLARNKDAPVSETKPEKPREMPRPAAGSAEGTVLVVDDEAPVRSIAVNMLKYLGYKVLEAQDGEEAISVLQASKTPIDAVMMDVYMPKLSGRDTYRQMRTLGIDVPVIVCSGFMVEPDEFTSLAQGRSNSIEVIQKPYSMEALARVVSRAIAKGHNALVA